MNNVDEIIEHKDDANVSEEEFREAIRDSDSRHINELVDSLSSQEVLRQTSFMDSEDRAQLLTQLSVKSAAKLVHDSHPDVAVPIIEDLETSQAAKIIEELPADAQVDIVQAMGKVSSEAILSQMNVEDADKLRELTHYSPESAGGLMEPNAFTFNADDSVATVLKSTIEEGDEFERHRGQHPYVLDSSGLLIGVVSLRNLLRSKRSIKLSEIMVSPVTSVLPDVGQDEMATIFHDNPFLGIPVVNSEGRLLGVVSRVAVADAALERAEQASLHRNQTGDELRSMPLLLRSKRRLSWLSANIVLNILAASVISAYEETLAAVIAIAIFLPMVSDMSGCSGNQAVGVSMRELALGLTKPSDLFHVLRKELSVGIINGIVLGILIGLVAWYWKENFYLGLVIGLALSINTILAVAIGGSVPLILKRLGVDPAVASGPLLTTVTDMAGFFLVLSLASLFMTQLLVI